jgi:crotonobetainyl-CoA:carnitine CoA-transferase CaiB-like acyl-CoA transferase
VTWRVRSASRSQRRESRSSSFVCHLHHTQGKHSIILDAKKPAAREVIRKAVEAADVVLLNKMDDQLVKLGLNRETLDLVNKKAII